MGHGNDMGAALADAVKGANGGEAPPAPTTTNAPKQETMEKLDPWHVPQTHYRKGVLPIGFWLNTEAAQRGNGPEKGVWFLYLSGINKPVEHWAHDVGLESSESLLNRVAPKEGETGAGKDPGMGLTIEEAFSRRSNRAKSPAPKAKSTPPETEETPDDAGTSDVELSDGIDIGPGTEPARNLTIRRTTAADVAINLKRGTYLDALIEHARATGDEELKTLLGEAHDAMIADSRALSR